jgi:hypothetical protein
MEKDVKASDLIRGIYYATSSVNAVAAQQYIHLLNQYFDRNEYGEYLPKKIKVRDGDAAFDIPVVSLVKPQCFKVERVQVRMTGEMGSVGVKSAKTNTDNSQITRASLSMKLDSSEADKKKANEFSLDITLSSVDPPETFMQLIDQLNKQTNF